MPTSPTRRNTACATIAAAAVPRRARPPPASPPAPSPARSIPAVTIRGALVQIGPHRIARDNWDWAEIDRNPFFSPDAAIVERWSSHLDEMRRAGSSTGAVIEIRASGVPPGWGAPIYGKLDQDLAAAMMSINAVKGVEIGAGFAAAALTGEENADEIRIKDGRPEFLSNNAGGILGGISSGQDIVLRFAVKPTSSILTPRRTVDRGAGGNRDQHQGPP